MLHDLTTIVYVSSAMALLSPSSLEELLEQSRERNARENITGLLLYCEGNFMQCIEGPNAPLQGVYASIKRDSRHHGLLELVQHPIEAREFAQWSMAFSHAHRQQMDALVHADGGGRPQDAAGISTTKMLAAFWREQMRLHR